MRYGEDDKRALLAGDFDVSAGAVTSSNRHDVRRYVGVSATHCAAGHHHAVSTYVKRDDEEGALLECYAALANWMRMKGLLDG